MLSESFEDRRKVPRDRVEAELFGRHEPQANEPIGVDPDGEHQRVEKDLAAHLREVSVPLGGPTTSLGKPGQRIYETTTTAETPASIPPTIAQTERVKYARVRLTAVETRVMVRLSQKTAR